MMLIIEGPAGNGIGKSVSQMLGCSFIECRHSIFPDGESEVGIIGPISGEDVFIVQSTYPLQDKRLIELMLIADHVKKQGAKSICAVVPYLAYARQDRSFIEKSNAISISAILGMLNFAGISRLITAAPHSAKVIEAFSGMVSVVDAITPLANLLKGEIANPIILAPDKGALGIAEKFANVIGCGYTYLEKERDRITGEVKILKAPDTDFSGRDVIVADDMISTGGTTAQAARFAYANGANKVIAAAVHLLMAGNAYDKIKGAGVDLICGTNTIPCDNARIADISKEIAAAISGQ